MYVFPSIPNIRNSSQGWAQLAECLPRMQESLGSQHCKHQAWRDRPSISALRQKQEDLKFKVILGYAWSLKPGWETWKQKTRKEETKRKLLKCLKSKVFNSPLGNDHKCLHKISFHCNQKAPGITQHPKSTDSF